MVGFLSILIGVGTTIDAVAVFVKPMSESLGWTRTAFMGPVTVAAVATSLASPFVGWFIDTHGARLLMPTGAFLGGVLLMLISRVTDPWHFYLLFGVGLGLTRPCFSFVAATATVSKWFLVKRGRALALTTMGAAISSVAILPVTQYVITRVDWRTAWIVLGLLAWVLLALPSGFVLRRAPEDMGLAPDGGSPDPDEGDGIYPARKRPTSRVVKAETDWPAQAAIRTRAFWLLLASVTFSSFAVIGVWLHASAAYTDQGVQPAAAAFAMASVAFTSIPARVFWGLLAERIHVRHCALISNLGLGAAVLCIMLATSFSMAVAAMLLFGVFVGGTIVYGALLWPQYFGRRALGTIQGCAELFRVVGVAGGPLFAGRVYDITHSYHWAFAIFTVSCLLAGVMVYFARPPVLPGMGASPGHHHLAGSAHLPLVGEGASRTKGTTTGG